MTITVRPSNENTPEEFKDVISLLPSEMANHNPAITITGQGFGTYSIAGYDTLAFAFRDAEDPSNPTKNMMLISRIGYQKMTIVFRGDPQSFDQQWPVIQKMIDLIKITGIR